MRKKTPNTNGLVKKTNYDTKITVIEKEILITIRSVEQNAENGTITEFEDKMPDVNDFLTQKSDFDAKN